VAKAKINVKAYGNAWAVQHDVIELTEMELDGFLNQIPRKDNPLKVTAKELMEFSEGRGELALAVDLSGKYKEMRDLKNALARKIRKHMENDPDFYMGFNFTILSFKAGRNIECGQITIT
jgi:hypothetical protein